MEDEGNNSKRDSEEKETDEEKGISDSSVSGPCKNSVSVPVDEIRYNHTESCVSNNDGDGDCAPIVEKLENAGLDEKDSGECEDEEEEKEGVGIEEKNGGGGGDGGDELGSCYPRRPDAADCVFYLKTGTCKYGVNCSFNHPVRRVVYQVSAGDKEKESHGLSEDTEKIQCRYHLLPGGCKYGDSCRYDHSKKHVNAQPPALNFLGLPIRLGEKECPFYMRNGSCAYEAKCRFHHPDPTEAKEAPNDFLASDENTRVSHSSATQIHTYPSGLSQAETFSNGTTLGYGMSSRHCQSSLYSASPQYQENKLNQVVEFPERPGQPECAYFMKTGYCKFKSACKYHHPQNGCKNDLNKEGHSNWDGRDPSTDYDKLMLFTEFPEHPSQPECEFFMKYGDCKFRSACRYHHPKSRLLELPVNKLMGNNFPTKPEPIAFVADSKLPYMKSNYANNKHQAVKQQQHVVGEYPERPGEPDCEFYMRTGDCKYKSACRYNHPRNRASTSSSFALRDKGLPLRTGSRLCRNYEQQGFCKYGSHCLFDHSVNISPSSPVPIVPAPVSPLSEEFAAEESGRGWFL
ncbi:Zinc finger CCCH domain-containing protein [Drosera capensis]